ncbi:hypothetical protein ACOMHN_006843 [Nucella lapillus]
MAEVTSKTHSPTHPMSRMAEVNQSTDEMQWLAPPRLPLFSGESDNGPAEDFIQEVHRVLAAYEMAKPLAVEYIIRHLQGKARREVLLRDREDTNTPEKVTNILQEVFGDGRRVTTLLSIFYSRQQQPEESAFDYSHVLRGLERTLHMKDAGSLTADFLRDRFVEGLFNPALRTHLRRMTRRKPQTTFFQARNEAMRWLQEEQELEEQDRQRVTRPELTLMQHKVVVLENSIRLMQESMMSVQALVSNKVSFKKRKRRRRKRRRDTTECQPMTDALKARDSNPLSVKETPARGSNPHGWESLKSGETVDKTKDPLPDLFGIEDEAQKGEWVLLPTSPKPVTTGCGSSPVREGDRQCSRLSAIVPATRSPVPVSKPVPTGLCQSHPKDVHRPFKPDANELRVKIPDMTKKWYSRLHVPCRGRPRHNHFPPCVAVCS